MRPSETQYRQGRLGSVGLASRVNLSAEIGGSRSGFREVAGEDGLHKGAEDDLGTTTKCQRCVVVWPGRLERTKSEEETSTGRGRT